MLTEGAVVTSDSCSSSSHTSSISTAAVKQRTNSLLLSLIVVAYCCLQYVSFLQNKAILKSLQFSIIATFHINNYIHNKKSLWSFSMNICFRIVGYFIIYLDKKIFLIITEQLTYILSTAFNQNLI